jgi:hypothetical protein
MTFLKWIAAAALIGSATACVDNTPYNGTRYGYAPVAYDYNQPTYYRTHDGNGQPIYNGYRQPTYYGYQQQQQPAFGYPQPTYYGR